MNRTEFAKARVPSSVEVAKSNHPDGSNEIGSISERMRSGRAFLKVVAYPWGVEFELPDGEEAK